MSDSFNFSVDTRLTRLLSEGYRSSEVALKELVDNAWDADATLVEIIIPEPLSKDPLVISDNGSGMTASEIESAYLNIASDRRARSGEKTPIYRRQVKGRKGIGKFAGLTIAGKMVVHTSKSDEIFRIVFDKAEIEKLSLDLEKVPIPYTSREKSSDDYGTRIELTELDDRLNFPTSERLKEVLVREYARSEGFEIRVNDQTLTMSDIRGVSSDVTTKLPAAGEVALRFTIAEGKGLPKTPGIQVKVDGKSVGPPILLGLDDDEEIPRSLAKRVYGEVEIPAASGLVASDWSGIIENSKAFEEAKSYCIDEIKAELRKTHSKELGLQKARLQKQINKRLEKLPEFRRKFARDALNRILQRYYQESDERIAVIADVALDAMEHDAYWAVLDKINKASEGDVSSFADSLEQFGFVELSTIAMQARHRLEFLDFLDQLIFNPATLEKETHKALDKNLWVFGRAYSAMSSNATLKSVVDRYCEQKYSGKRAEKRPDLLLSQNYSNNYLLIEFKRPSHPITRDDVAQVEKYRDDLTSAMSSTSLMNVMLVGKGKTPTLNSQHLASNISIHGYAAIISSARTELDWLVKSLVA